MTSSCHSLLSQGMFQFKCPYVGADNKRCDRDWPYFLVRHVACLSVSEQKTFETKLSENYLMKARNMQQCPGCHNWSFREAKINPVQCVICTKKNGSAFKFFWFCLSIWSSSSVKICQNIDCSE